MRKNYLFVVGQLGNGGLERQLLYLCTELLRYGNSVVVIVWNGSEKDYYYKSYSDILHENLFLIGAKDSSKSKIVFLRMKVKSSSFTHILSFSAFTNFIVFLCSLGSGARVYGALRTSFNFYLKEQGFKALLNVLFPSRIIVNSFAGIDEIKNHKGINIFSSPSYLANVIDIKKIQALSDVGVSDFICSNKCFITISIGNVRKAKRLDRLVTLFSYIKSSCPELEIHHLHLGGGELENLKELIREKGLSDYLTLKGATNNVYPYLKKADVLLHFSDTEGASNVIMEAMALGKPVISTNCGDTKRYIKNDINGWVIDSYTAEAFALKIKLLMTDNSLCDRISANNNKEIMKFDVRESLTFFEEAII